MKTGGTGGANTQSGLRFEEKTDILTLLSKRKDYRVEKNIIYYKEKEVARTYKKYDFYAFLEKNKVNWKQIISKRLLPDDAIYVISKNTLHIIEVKFQRVAGSVDEKLQTCDFKKRQYKKLLAPLNINVEYIYILSNWFRDPSYKDVLEYILSVGCHYYFEYLPLEKIGLPFSEEITNKDIKL